MLEYTIFGIKIKIKNISGIYIMGSNSATGKTRLFKLLRKLSEIEKSIVTYTYNDEKCGTFLDDILSEKDNVKLIIIDRFDMLKNKYETFLPEYAKNTVILIDCKHNCPFDDFESSVLKFEQKLIEVFI